MAASAIGKEKLTVSNSVVAFASVTATAYSALVSVEGGAIRYYADGSTPSATDGIAADVGDQFIVSGDLSRFKAIRRDSSDATLQIIYLNGYLDPGKKITETVAGSVAAGTADSGYPVKVGGKYNVTRPTLVDQQRGDLQLGARGAALAQLADFDGVVGAEVKSITADTITSPNALRVGAYPHLFNGASWDRQRANIDTAALISAAGLTTSQTGADQTNYNGRGLKVVFDMTVVGTGSVTVTIQGKDPVSGKYYTLLAGAAVITNVTNVYTVYPGIAVAANVSASDVLPRTWRVITTANNANATTYTVAASVIV